MNLYEKIAAELITSLTLVALFVAFLKDRREKRRDDKAAAAATVPVPSIEKCAIKEEVDQELDKIEGKFEKIEEKFNAEREARERLGEKVQDAFVKIGENRTRIIMMLEFLKNKSF